MESNKENTSRKIITEAILLLIITAGSYWISFKYESSYFSVYKIPIHLIDVSTTLLLTTVLSLSGAIFLVLALWNLVLMFFPKQEELKLKVVRTALLLLLPIWYLISYGFRMKDIWLYIGIVVVIIFFEFLWPLLVFKGQNKSLKEKFKADEEAEEQMRAKTIFGRVYYNFGPLPYIIILFFYFASILVGIYGTAKAENQKIFPVDVNDPNVAVVRMYKDRFICVRFDLKTKKIESYFLRDIVGDEYKNENIGPLNP